MSWFGLFRASSFEGEHLRSARSPSFLYLKDFEPQDLVRRLRFGSVQVGPLWRALTLALGGPQLLSAQNPPLSPSPFSTARCVGHLWH